MYVMIKWKRIPPLSAILTPQKTIRETGYKINVVKDVY